VQCQNFQGRWSVGEPDVALKCAQISGIDWKESGVGTCAGLDASGTAPEGVALLHESVLRTKSMGVEWVPSQPVADEFRLTPRIPEKAARLS
jgi:hypothetical protein